MISNKLIVGLLLLLLTITFVIASQTVLNFPQPFSRHTATNINFTWNSSTSDVGGSTNYLFIEARGNGTFFLNGSVDCTNNTLCNLSVSDFVVGRYQWEVQTVENSTNASIASVHTDPFDFITVETAATMTGTESELFNLTANNALTITYTVGTVEEFCVVNFDGTLSDNHTTITVAQNITAAGCNVTVTNTTGNITLTTTTAGGTDEHINVSGNSTTALGLGTTVFIGTQDGNTSLTFNYTVEGVDELCEVIFPLSDNVNITTVVGNVSDACNVSASSLGGALRMISKGHGDDEFILMTGGNSTHILGFTVGELVVGTEDNFTSDSSYFDIRSTTGGNLTINLRNDTQIFGDLFLHNPPAACPAGSFMTQFVGNASTCTGSGITIQVNFTGGCNLTYSGGLLTATEGCS